LKRILVLQHESYHALGTWGSILREKGKRLRFVNFERTPDANPGLDGYDAIILLGGYMGIYESDSYAHLKIELKLIEEALKREMPILGICLGSQILAAVLGASVRKHTEREMGWYDVSLTEAGVVDPVIGHFGRVEKVFQSHGDIFDVPASAEHLARSEVCEGQAFRYGKNAYGLQFHLEVNREIVDDWLVMPENQEHFSGGGRFSPELIRKDTERYLERSMTLSEATFRSFLKNAKPDGEVSRRIWLGSGHDKGET
jgi:GMP synthase (glutamine-hydrolysing)